MQLEKVYVVTMWSGGRASRKWKTLEEPELLATGTGLSFTSMDTKLAVRVIGSLSVEEYEQGAKETQFSDAPPSGEPQLREGDAPRRNPGDKPDLHLW